MAKRRNAPRPGRALVPVDSTAWLSEVIDRPTVEGLRAALDFFDRTELDVVEKLRAGGTSWNELRHAYGVTTPQGARLRVLRLRERLDRPRP